MTASYLNSRKWSLASRSVITDDTGTERFEVQGPLAFSAGDTWSGGCAPALITPVGSVAVRCLQHLREDKLEGPSMADPFTLGAVGAVVLTEGIKFLYGRLARRSSDGASARP